MISALIVFYFFIALSLITLVLLQDPKGDGAIFGGGGSQSLFGATGATSFIVKATRVVAVLFALCVIGLNYSLMSQNSRSAIYENTNDQIEAPVLEAPEEGVTPTEESEASQPGASIGAPEDEATSEEGDSATEAQPEATQE